MTSWEERELKELPEVIQQLEAELAALTERLGSAELYQAGPDEVAKTQAELDRQQAQLAKHYERWEQLEARQSTD